MAVPFGATVSGARKLALDAAAEGVRPNNVAKRISDDTVLNWLEQAGGKVRISISRMILLPLTFEDAQATERIKLLGIPDQQAVTLEARHLCELYAAALIQDVNHPQAAKDGGYGRVLMDRYQLSLNELVGIVNNGADMMKDLDPDTPGIQGAGGIGSFPPPRIRDCQGF